MCCSDHSGRDLLAMPVDIPRTNEDRIMSDIHPNTYAFHQSFKEDTTTHIASYAGNRVLAGF